jgi:hypothetical protein
MTHQQFIDQLKEGDKIKVKARRGYKTQAILSGFKGTFIGFVTDKLGRPAVEVRNADTQGTHQVLAKCVIPGGSGSVVVVGSDGTAKRKRKSGGTKIANGKSVREPQDCKCKCGGKTGGGNFLPGHDARLVSMVVKGERKPTELKPFPKLLAKYERKMELLSG